MNNYPRAMGLFDMCEKKNEEFQKYINVNERNFII